MIASLTRSMTRDHIEIMSISMVTISIDESLLKRADRLVSSGLLPNRTHVIQQAIEEKIARMYSTASRESVRSFTGRATGAG